MSSQEQDNDNSLFPYEANAPAAIIFIVLFGILLFGHIYQAAKGRTRYMLTVIFATAFQVVGYVCRYLTIKNEVLAVFIVSQVLIVISPAVLAAQVYMIVGRMMAFVGPESTWISHSVITKVFVILDVIFILSQASGSSMLSSEDENGLPNLDAMRAGRLILIAALAAQVIAFGIFMILTVFFHRKSIQLKGEKLDVLKTLFWAFYISSTLITVRSIFRTIEFAQIDFEQDEPNGYLYVNEWPFYVLDSVPVVIATGVYNLWHPSKYLPRKKGERMDGTVEPPRKHWWSKAPPAVQDQPSMELSNAQGRVTV